MRPLERAPWAPERIDSPDHDRATLVATYAWLDVVNRWLGGVGPVWRALRRLPRNGTLRLLDIGAGAAGLAGEIARRARRAARPVFIVAMDINRVALSIARDSRSGTSLVTAGDALRLPFTARAFDAAVLSLTLHHIPDEQQVAALREAGRVAHWVIVTDLERTRLHYAGVRLLAVTLWRAYPCCREDGPVSVLRGYTADELRDLARAAGLRHANVSRNFFHRLLLVARGNGESS